jgi:hypothetical protein
MKRETMENNENVAEATSQNTTSNASSSNSVAAAFQYTADDLAKARAQEKEKVYPQIEKMRDELAQLKKENAAIYAFWMQPDLKPIFEKAVSDGTIASLQTGSQAAAQKFSAALQPWLSTHGSSMLAAESDKATMSGKYKETLANRQLYVKDIATQMGYNALTSDQINSIASLSFNTDYLDSSFQTQSGQDRLKTLIANSAAAAKMQLTGGTGATGANGSSGIIVVMWVE